MSILAFVFIFFLGTVIGSFLNVVIYRFNTGRSVAKGRSICMTCSHTLSWYELIPVLSFLFQKGRCRSCASRISHQYPLVEFITGLIFALLAFYFLPLLPVSLVSYLTVMVFFSFLFSLLIVISVYDIRHKVIPDKLVYVFAFFSFVSIFIAYTNTGPVFVTPTLYDVIAGPLFAVPFALIWLVSRGRWMGLGDAKLVLGIGWMLGISSGLAAVILSFWIGSVVSLLMMLFIGRKMTMKTEIPFAPFLILGTLIAFLFNLDMYSLAALFQF
jgi:prepilin signal peptidase PulO-like enzyme (type II secretory pathway)